MFDLSWKPTNDYWTTSEDIKKILDAIPKIDTSGTENIKNGKAWELLRTIQEISNSINAWVNENESVFWFVPFCFYETWTINPRQTAENFSREKCITFYLDIVDKKPWYKKYEELIPNIRKYFTISLDWNWRDECLRWYWETIRALPEECKEKCIISLNWWLDFGAMKSKFWLESSKRIIDDILSNKAPFEWYFTWELVDKFFDNIWATENIVKFENDVENLMEFFDIITFSFKNTTKWVYEEIEDLGNNMWDSYEKFFKIMFEAYDIAHKDWDWNIENNDLFEVWDWFDESWAYTYEDILKDIIIEIIRSMAGSSVRLPQNDFLPALFASYRKKWRNSDVMMVYKRNIINKYLRDGVYINAIHNSQEKQDRTNQFKLAIKNIDEIFYNGWIIIHTPTWMRTSKETFINFSPEQRKIKIKERIEDKKSLAIKINELERLLVATNLNERFKINLWTEEICCEIYRATLKLSSLLEEESENRTIKLLEREEEVNKKNIEIDNNEDFISNWLLWHHRLESRENNHNTVRYQSSNGDDDLPF